MSWEFRRNLWIQMTPQRLIITPLALGLAFFASAKTNLALIAPETLFWLFAALWGTRRAADAITEEIVGGTWHGQRMAAIGAWAMTWGKLFGATAFTWYGALLAWLLYAATTVLDVQAQAFSELPSPGKLLSMLIFVLLAQTTSLLVALIQMQRRRRGRQFTLGLAQLAGLATLFPYMVANAELRPVRLATIWWYGWPFPPLAFACFSGAVFFLWALAGVHYLMRAELQYREMTWRMPLFALFLIAYVSGFVPARFAGSPFAPALLALNGAVMLALFYVTLLSLPGEPITLLRWGRALRQGSWRAVLELTPPFVAVGIVVLAIGIAAIAQATTVDDWMQAVGPAALNERNVAFWLAAVLLYTARDTLIVLLFAVGRRPERADINSIMTLTLLHGLVPVTLLGLGESSFVGVTSPVPGGSSSMTLAAAVVQLTALSLLLAHRMGRLQPAAPRAA